MVCWGVVIERVYALDWRLDKMMAQPLFNSKSVALGNNMSGGEFSFFF